jgi:hypothetical protein
MRKNLLSMFAVSPSVEAAGDRKRGQKDSFINNFTQKEEDYL